MPGAKHVDQYLEAKDKFGVRIGSWVVKHSLGILSCRYCSTKIDFSKGIGPLLKHSESNKHRFNAPNTSS